MRFFVKRIISALLVTSLALGLMGCGIKKSEKNDDVTARMWRIGVCQSDDSEYGDIILDGFTQAMADELPDDSVTFTREYITENKSGAMIATEFVRDESDLILTIGTPALKGASCVTEEIPIITTDAIDIQSAVNIPDLSWDMRTKRNITGITGMPNIPDQLALILEVAPEIDTLAIVYGKNDLYSIEQSRLMQDYLTEAGIDRVMYQLGDVTKKKILSICKKSDAIYIPAESTLVSEAEKITRIAAEKNIPTIGGDVNIGKNTLVCLSPDYYGIGYTAGKQAASVLGKGKNPGKISVEFNAAQGIKLYNQKVAQKMGISFPKSFHLYDPEDLSTSLSGQ